MFIYKRQKKKNRINKLINNVKTSFPFAKFIFNDLYFYIFSFIL